MSQKTPSAASPSAATPKSGLGTRVLTAAIGIPLVGIIVYLGGWPFFFLVLALAWLGLGELIAAARQHGTPLVTGVAYAALLWGMLGIIDIGFMGYSLFRTPLSVQFTRTAHLGILPWLMIVVLLFTALRRYATPRKVSLSSLSLTVMGTLYVGLFVFLPLLREREPDGAALMWLTLIGVWTGDTLAFFAGRAFGRRKLTPLSPGKTREGAVGGVLSTILVCALIGRFSLIGLGHGVVLGVLIGLATPLGDLAESFWKRELGVKDLGRLLPGHGGVLDRCDSLLFAAFVVYCYATILMR